MKQNIAENKRVEEIILELEESIQDEIKTEMEFIPENTDKTELPKKLESILKKLAKKTEPEAEAILTQVIQRRFKLKSKDVEAYRALLNRYRKKNKSDDKQNGNSEREVEFTALFDGLIDLVDDNGEPAFLIKDGDSLVIKSQIERDGVICVPPPKDKIPWQLPRSAEVLKHYEIESAQPSEVVDKTLFNDLVNYHKEVSELPNDDYYELVTAWVLHTYLIDMFQYTPIVCLFAIPERGKSRTGKAMIYVAFRGIHVESLREAYLVRMASYFKASLFLDVKDIWRKAERNGSEDILLQRFEKGTKVARVLNPERKPHEDMRYFSIFGATVIATNEAIHKILETRAISISMPESSRKFDNEITPEVALPLRERLVSFRVRHLDTPLPNMKKPAHGRLGDILKPLHQIIRMVNPEREESFLRLVKELEKERLIDKGDTIEAHILVTIFDLKDTIEHGALPVKEITEKCNDGKAEREKISSQRIGRILKAMGFKKQKTNSGASAILWDKKLIDKLSDKYGLKETSVIPDIEEIPSDEAGNTGVSDVTELS